MFGLGMGEIIIILVFALIFIGPKKLPEIAKNIGKGMREFQRAKQGLMDEINRTPTETHSEPQQTPPDQEPVVESQTIENAREAIEAELAKDKERYPDGHIEDDHDGEVIEAEVVESSDGDDKNKA